MDRWTDILLDRLRLVKDSVLHEEGYCMSCSVWGNEMCMVAGIDFLYCLCIRCIRVVSLHLI